MTPALVRAASQLMGCMHARCMYYETSLMHAPCVPKFTVLALMHAPCT